MSGYSVDLDALQAAEKGIADTISELRKLGFHGQERSGVTLMALKLDADDSGHVAITDGLDDVLDRYRWWVCGLIESTEEIVDALVDTRTTYEQVEDQVAQSLKSLLDMTIGNPLNAKPALPESPR